MSKLLSKALLLAFTFLCLGLNAQVTPTDANTDAECGADCWDLFSWSTVQDGSGTNIPNFSEGVANDANCNTTIDASAEYFGADSNGPDLVGTSIGANLQGTSTDLWVIGFGEELTSPVINFSALETSTNVLITDCDGNEITANCISSCGANLMFTPGVGWNGDVAYSLQLSGTYDCINISFDVTNNDAYNFSIGTCLSANPLPPCVSCGTNEDFEYLNLVNKMGSGTGATADVELDNVLVGSAEVLFSDLDINEDLSGTTFGGFDNDGGTYLLKLTFCEPISVQQFEIKNLEVESEVSIGTTISGSGASAVLGGLALTQCAGSNKMSLNDGAPNLVITDGPGCGANPNGSYTLDNAMVDCLYFKYRNPDGGCSFDYVGFKIGSCVSDGADAIPVCPLTYVTYATDIVDYVDNGPDFIGNDANAFQVMRDANGNYFDQNCTQIQNEVENGIAIPTMAISPCAEVVDEEDCDFCTPVPPCATCPGGTDYAFIRLTNGTGSGPGATGDVELDGVVFGSFTVLASDLDVNEDISGTQFGGFDNDGGTYLLEIEFCEEITVEELYIRNLEVESEVSIGTMASAMDATANLSGLTLTQCDGSTRMGVDPNPANGEMNFVKTDGPGCGANPNGVYTVGGTAVSTLYFKYHNPPGGCSYDYVGFKVGTCVAPDPDVVPSCPLSLVTVTTDPDDVLANGITNGNTDQYVMDSDGIMFDYQSCTATALQNAIDNATALPQAPVGPCAEVVDVEECSNCPPMPICATCPANSIFSYIDLSDYDDMTNMGVINLEGMPFGSFEVLTGDDGQAGELDVNVDTNGERFGGFDNDGGTLLMRLDFDSPLNVDEFEIFNLEVMSEVSVGTTASTNGTDAVLSGLSLTQCSGSMRMGVGPAPNEVITDGPGCGANPNGTYTFDTPTISTLYIKYTNPDGGCSFDYVGFKVGSCVSQCDLVVDCSNITDQTLACRADLPPVDFDLPIVVDSCGDVIHSALTIIPGNTGCPGDTLTITRTYFQQDSEGNMAECMQTFTVISTMDPVFTFFPADTTVLCGADTSPGAVGMAEGEGECHPATPQATVTSNDVITPGACPAEMTITRTWTVTDRCGRSTMMDQIINVVDTIPPMMICQDVTIQLDDMGMATLSPDQVNNGSSDNCGGAVMLSLSQTAFNCDNIGTNMVTLTGVDECGNMATCEATITVEDNVMPIAICQDVTLSLDDLGNATISLPGGGSIINNGSNDNCTPDDELIISLSVSDFTCADIPLGQASVTLEVIMTVTDAEGNSSTCPAMVTIMDDTPPIVDCPNDIFVQLEAGECEEIVFFDIPFSDNCGTMDAEASQAINEGLVNTALDCANNTSNHLRYFTNNSPVPVEITQVNFGIFNSGTTETVTVNVYSIAPAAAFEYGNMTLQGTVDYDVPAGMNNVILTAMLEATIPAGMNYVLELKANNTTNFVIGYNNLGETGSTYIAGNNPVPCVSLEPVDIDVLGFGAFAVILYSNAEGGPTIEQTEGLPSGSYFPLGTTTNTYIVTDVNGNTTECTFDVTMVEYSNGVTGVMSCNDNINVSLDMDCQVVLGADMLLEGGAYGCYDHFDINVSGGVTGNVITQPGTYTVTITDPDTGNSCWSTINVEDKSAPTIEECACPVGGSEVMTPFVGTLDGTDPIWTRPFVAGGACNPSGAGVDIPYDTYNFSLDMDAGLGAEVVSFSAPSGDSFLCLYEESFDPTDPCGNLVITNDDGGVGLLSQFDVMLNSGVNYILVVTTFNNNGNDFGDYVVEITSDATLLELAEECNFRCVDIEYIMGSDDLTPNPTITSCSDYEAFFTDELTVDANGNQIILRTWLAQNANGSSTCTQQFNIAPIAIDELTLPISPVILSCNDGTSPEEIVAIFDNPLTQDNPNTSYVENNEGYVYAYPTYLINGHPQKVDNQVCDVYAAYTDQELDACEEGCNGNKKVIRTWTLVDWNTLEISTYIQTIKAVDTEAPTLITQDVTVSTDAWGCEASFEAPLPWELHDNCDSYPEYYITGPAGVTIEGSFEEGYVISGAPKGTHTFNYIAYDCCGNEASYPFTVTVIDSTPPVVVAKQNVVISVTSGSTNGAGLAKLYAESIDNGSYDGCSNEVKLEVRRDEDNCDIRGNATYNADGHPQDGSPNPNSPSYDPDGGAYVKFCCEDLTNATVDVNGDGELDAGYVKVWLRVWDDGDMDGIYGTAGDNYNEAWAYVKVEDKLAPAITCPPDVTLTCDMDYTDLNMTGSASAYGSCGGVDVEYNDIIINLNSCNEGFVRRRWSVVGRSDIFCDQTITMDELDAPVNVSFSQVGDFTAANCPDMIALGEPTWIAGPCDVMGYTMETDTFFFEDGACYKLVNHYTVINWCDYEPNNPFWDGEGLWEHVQVIKVTDETQPVIEDCDDKMYAINDHSDSDDDGEVCEAKITLENVATDEGSANCPTGWLKWQVLVDLWGDGTVDLEYSSFLPPFDTQFNDTNGNGIPDVYLSPTANGETVSVPLPDIVGSMSNHKVSWKVTDGCNNVTTCDTEFMVVDKKAPTPYMVSLSSAIMDEVCTVELWAIDFNIGSFDNCTAQEDLRYTFSDTPPEDDPNYDDALHSSSMTFDGDDVLNSPVAIQVYVWDEKGNADFAQVSLTLVDNHGCVDPPPPPMDECSCEPTDYTGWAVGTCNAEEGTDGAVGVIYNMTNTENAPSEMDYATSITTIHPANWTVDQIGQVFGIAMDNSDNVFLAASDVYDTGYDNDPYGPGQIFKASAGNNFIAEPFVELPNTGGSLNGIGNIAYCNDNEMLYASNLEDGMIYRINASGAIMETYDPWTADDGSAGLADVSEQVWGIGLNKEDGSKKLYFPRITDGADGERAMYSITLNENGSFPGSGSEVVEFDGIMGVGLRISDIAFNTGGDQMVFAERGTRFVTGAHDSKVLRYDLVGGTWMMELKYFVGGWVTPQFPSIDVEPGENTGGGVDFGATGVSSNGIEGCDELVWSSMHYVETSDGSLYYGMQGMSADGNNSSESASDPNFMTDIIIDYDGAYDNFDQKGDLGDVEIFKCGGSTSTKPMIAGMIETEGGMGVEEVEVNLGSVLPEYPVTTMTDATGYYAFPENALNADYQLTSSKDVDYLNGVSTLDLVKIQRHILGLEELNSPYKLIAADINGDTEIKAHDLVELRKLILGIITDLPTNESWRFVNRGQSMDMGMDLNDIDYSVEVDNLESDEMSNHFVAVKIGDVTEDAIANLSNGATAVTRSNNKLLLSILNQEVEAGQEVSVGFTSEDFQEVFGYQFTMELNGLEFAGIESGVVAMNEGNVGVLSSNVVTMSYNSSTAVSAGKDETIFTVNFIAKTSGNLSNMIDITSKVTNSEAYVSTSIGETLEIRNVEIEMRGDVVEVETSELYQNEPNPFKTQTTIGYRLAAEGKVNFTVHDVTGKVLINKSLSGVRGYNEITLKSNDLGVSGVLYYTLESGEFTATKKMIILE